MKSHQSKINIAAALILIFMLLHFLGVFNKLGLQLDTISLVLLFSAISIFLLPLLSKFKIFGVFELEKAQNEIKELKVNIYRSKVVKDEASINYFIDKEMVYHLLPDKETCEFLEYDEGQLLITKKELKSNYTEGEKFDSVLKESTKILWVNRRDIFIILNGKRFWVPSWDFLNSWKRDDDTKFGDISAEKLRGTFPKGR